MTTYNISINDELATLVEKAIKHGGYANRSEFFRDLIRKFYFRKEEFLIEELDPSDPDYKYIEDMKKDKNSEWTSIEDVAKEFNVEL